MQQFLASSRMFLSSKILDKGLAVYISRTPFVWLGESSPVITYVLMMADLILMATYVMKWLLFWAPFVFLKLSSDFPTQISQTQSCLKLKKFNSRRFECERN